MFKTLPVDVGESYRVCFLSVFV